MVAGGLGMLTMLGRSTGKRNVFASALVLGALPLSRVGHRRTTKSTFGKTEVSRWVVLVISHTSLWPTTFQWVIEGTGGWVKGRRGWFEIVG